MTGYILSMRQDLYYLLMMLLSLMGFLLIILAESIDTLCVSLLDN